MPPDLLAFFSLALRRSLSKLQFTNPVTPCEASLSEEAEEERREADVEVDPSQAEAGRCWARVSKNYGSLLGTPWNEDHSAFGSMLTAFARHIVCYLDI